MDGTPDSSLFNRTDSELKLYDPYSRLKIPLKYSETLPLLHSVY
jgi:hypothetical protein